MKRQDMFNIIVDHLRKQNVKAIDSRGTCMYRKNKLKRAVGCLIPDDIYQPEMESQSIINLFNNYPKVRKLLGARNIDFLFDMQIIHDKRDVKEWERLWERYAKTYNVKYTPLEMKYDRI